MSTAAPNALYVVGSTRTIAVAGAVSRLFAQYDAKTSEGPKKKPFGPRVPVY